VVAFVPSAADSMEGTTHRSSEITLNGGCSEPYPPVVFCAASSHHLGQVDVRIAGANLEGVRDVPISAPDSSWSYLLTVTSKTDERISAHAVLAAQDAPVGSGIYFARATYAGGRRAVKIPVVR
jgi:hypothetical protein